MLDGGQIEQIDSPVGITSRVDSLRLLGQQQWLLTGGHIPEC